MRSLPSSTASSIRRWSRLLPSPRSVPPTPRSLAAPDTDGPAAPAAVDSSAPGRESRPSWNDCAAGRASNPLRTCSTNVRAFATRVRKSASSTPSNPPRSNISDHSSSGCRNFGRKPSGARERSPRKESAELAISEINCDRSSTPAADSPSDAATVSATAAPGSGVSQPDLQGWLMVSGSIDQVPRSATSSAASGSNPHVIGISGDSAVTPPR